MLLYDLLLLVELSDAHEVGLPHEVVELDVRVRSIGTHG